MTDDKKPKVSEGGSVVFRHQAKARPMEVAHGDGENITAIEAHVARHIGPAEHVFHELVSDLVHIDVHLVRPTPTRRAWTLFTTGMSDRPMNVPPGLTVSSYAEVMVSLPPTWQLDQAAFDDERNYWPVRWLKNLARLPHQYDTWLGQDHTVPNGDPAREFALGAGFAGVIMCPSVTLGPAFAVCTTPSRKQIAMLAMYPLYPEEMDLKLKKGASALFDAFERAGVTDIVEPGRAKVTRRKLFGLF